MAALAHAGDDDAAFNLGQPGDRVGKAAVELAGEGGNRPRLDVKYPAADLQVGNRGLIGLRRYGPSLVGFQLRLHALPISVFVSVSRLFEGAAESERPSSLAGSTAVVRSQWRWAPSQEASRVGK